MNRVLRRAVIAADSRLPVRDLADVRTALQVLPVVLGLCGAGGRAIRHTAGLVLAGWRLLRCNPFSRGGYDPVEAQRLFKSRGAGRERLIDARHRQHLPAADRRLPVGPEVLPLVGLSWGWSIVLLTVAVRAVLVPLTFRQIKSMVRMQALQPQMKEIQQKYKEDKPRQQQEIMKFYKENNVNPLASCLPMVLQLPVFISLYYMLRESLRNDICPSDHVPARAQRTPLPHAHGQTTASAASPRRRLPLHPRPHRKGDRGRVGHPDRPLHRVADRLDAGDVGVLDDGPDAAADHAVHAADVRAVRDPLPGRPDPLLDHHQPVDGRPAVHRSSAGTSARRWRSAGAAAETATAASVKPASGGAEQRPGGEWPGSATRAGEGLGAPQARAAGHRRSQAADAKRPAGGRPSGNELRAPAKSAPPRCAARPSPSEGLEQRVGARLPDARRRGRRARRRSAQDGGDRWLRQRIRRRRADRVQRDDGADRRHGRRRRRCRDPRGRATASSPSTSVTTSAVLIGHHGQTIDAIQHLAYRIASRGEEHRISVRRRRRRLSRAACGDVASDRRPGGRDRAARGARWRWSR